MTIIQKGPSDIISNGDRTETVGIEGGLKRVGGQGDILSGVTGTFLAWGKNFEEQQDEKRFVSKASLDQHVFRISTRLIGHCIFFSQAMSPCKKYHSWPQ